MDITNPGDLGRRIVDRRRELGLTRAEVAKCAGIDLHFLDYLEEQPSASCSVETLAQLADALETTPSRLGGAGFGQPQGSGPPPGGTPELEILDIADCLRLIDPGGIGRLVFNDDGRPVALPVNFRLYNGDVVFHTADGSIRIVVGSGVPVSLEVDRLDETLGEGWSVLVTGPVSMVDDIDDLRRITTLGIEPWAGGSRPHTVRLVPVRITGRRIFRHL